MLRHEAEAKLRDMAQKDPEFRKKLIANPNATISEALGVEIPATHKIRVVEESANEGILVLPPAAFVMSDDQLETVAGGYSAS